MTEDRPSSTHPPLPPTEEEDRVARLRLLRSHRVGIHTYTRLIAEHGSAASALSALPDVAAKAGVSRYTVCGERDAERELISGARFGARLIFQGSPDYPAPLMDLPDAPPFFWARGRLELLRQPSVAVIGARNASSLGGRMARALAKGLGEAGFVITSGLARGIDTAAHLAALDTGTVAVFAGGLDMTYPAENSGLASQIAEQGVIMSEVAMGVAPQARHFPPRNRIVSGLSRAVVVVEAAARSGSLITAKAALDQGREVLAVPGHPFDARSSGCNMLIRDGAPLVRGVDDILSVIGPAVPPPADPAPAAPPKPEQARFDLTDLHSQILNRLGPSPVAEDQLLRDLRIGAAQVVPVLTDLEMEGRIQRHPGGLLARVPS